MIHYGLISRPLSPLPTFVLLGVKYQKGAIAAPFRLFGFD